MSVPDDLYIGTVDALMNEPVTPAIEFLDNAPANFADAVSDAEGNFASGEGFFNMAAMAFSAADYADAAYDSAYGPSSRLISVPRISSSVGWGLWDSDG